MKDMAWWRYTPAEERDLLLEAAVRVRRLKAMEERVLNRWMKAEDKVFRATLRDDVTDLEKARNQIGARLDSVRATKDAASAEMDRIIDILVDRKKTR